MFRGAVSIVALLGIAFACDAAAQVSSRVQKPQPQTSRDGRQTSERQTQQTSQRKVSGALAAEQVEVDPAVLEARAVRDELRVAAREVAADTADIATENARLEAELRRMMAGAEEELRTQNLARGGIADDDMWDYFVMCMNDTCRGGSESFMRAACYGRDNDRINVAARNCREFFEDDPAAERAALELYRAELLEEQKRVCKVRSGVWDFAVDKCQIQVVYKRSAPTVAKRQGVKLPDHGCNDNKVKNFFLGDRPSACLPRIFGAAEHCFRVDRDEVEAAAASTSGVLIQSGVGAAGAGLTGALTGQGWGTSLALAGVGAAGGVLTATLIETPVRAYPVQGFCFTPDGMMWADVHGAPSMTFDW
ncbi:MAG: hypothetical protein FWD15_05690 [Alphaproteobacteria bacterium]|nr:hypothetical protein [Alphaproteobacteria bacterium]